MLKKSFFLTLIVIGLLLAVTMAVSAASGPIIDKGSGGTDRIVEWCDGFNIHHTNSYTYTDKYFFGESGLERIKTHVNGTDVLTNMNTGKALTGNWAYNDTAIFEGDNIYVHTSGQDWNITAPGFGGVFKQEGTAKYVVTPDGITIEHMSSSHTDGFFGNFTELCAALGE